MSVRSIPPRGSIPQRTKPKNVFTGHRSNGDPNSRVSSPRGVSPSDSSGVRPLRKTGPRSSLPIYPLDVEPPYDVFQEGSSIQVVLDMPGVNGEIEVTPEGKTLRVVAASTWRRFNAQVKLPREVGPEFAQQYHNGILIITLQILRG